tara:strand:- start:290 stop:664 length:375 start_codon:yes stop_codon:yes gene_type:complete
MKTTQCCCTSGYADGFVGYGIKLVMCKDSSRNCNSPTMTQKTSSMRYTMCYWNHCDNYGCANAQWGNGCLHCLESAGGGWPGWCCNVDSTWTGIMLKNNCGYMEPANTMSFWSVYGHRNPNITG